MTASPTRRRSRRWIPTTWTHSSFAAWRIGRCKESFRFAEQVFAELVRAEPEAAATKSVEVALAWLTRGDLNIGQGWMNRARRLLDGATEAPDPRIFLALPRCLDRRSHWQTLDVLVGQKVAELKAMSGRLDAPVSHYTRISERGARRHRGVQASKTPSGSLTRPCCPCWPTRLPIAAGPGEHHSPCPAPRPPARGSAPHERAWTQSKTRWCE